MKKLLIIVLFFILSTTSHINAKIVYIDINKILNDSDAGKKTINVLENEW